MFLSLFDRPYIKEVAAQDMEFVRQVINMELMTDQGFLLGTIERVDIYTFFSLYHQFFFLIPWFASHRRFDFVDIVFFGTFPTCNIWLTITLKNSFQNLLFIPNKIFAITILGDTPFFYTLKWCGRDIMSTSSGASLMGLMSSSISHRKLDVRTLSTRWSSGTWIEQYLVFLSLLLSAKMQELVSGAYG